MRLILHYGHNRQRKQEQHENNCIKHITLLLPNCEFTNALDEFISIKASQIYKTHTYTTIDSELQEIVSLFQSQKQTSDSFLYNGHSRHKDAGTARKYLHKTQLPFGNSLYNVLYVVCMTL